MSRTVPLLMGNLTNFRVFQERLHQIFQQILDETIDGVPPEDQMRLVLLPPQLEYPITFPFMACQHLTMNGFGVSTCYAIE